MAAAIVCAAAAPSVLAPRSRPRAPTKAAVAGRARGSAAMETGRARAYMERSRAVGASAPDSDTLRRILDRHAEDMRVGAELLRARGLCPGSACRCGGRGTRAGLGAAG